MTGTDDDNDGEDLEMSIQYCPECRTEFREGIEKCSDCGVSLVDHLEPVDHSHEEMVSVLDAIDTEQLLIAKTVLDGAGIENLVKDRGATAGLSFGGAFDPTGQPSHLMVPKSKLADAKALLTADSDQTEEE